jgi:hypothetical protein
VEPTRQTPNVGTNQHVVAMAVAAGAIGTAVPVVDRMTANTGTRSVAISEPPDTPQGSSFGDTMFKM